MTVRCSYTLLETIVAVAVVMMVLGVAMINFSNLRLEKSPMEHICELRRMSALCRRAAIAQGKAMAVSYRHKQRMVCFAGERIIFPENMKLTVNAQVLEQDRELIRFFPDGNASCVTVELTLNDEIAGMTVSPLTGVMEVYEKE